MHVLRSRILVAMGLGAQTMLGASCGNTSDNGKDASSGSAAGTSATSGEAAGGTAAEGQGGGSSASAGGASTAGGDDTSTSSESASQTSAGGASTAGGDDASTSSESASQTSAGGASAGGANGGSAGSAGNTGAGGTSSVEFCQPWPSCATVRRPFLVGSDLRSAHSRARQDWLAPRLAEAEVAHARTREFLAQAWLKDALEEHASVAAFARFTMLLLSVGAPPDLVAASQRASLDEVKHARDCFALAKRYGSHRAGPDVLDLAGAVLPLSLAELVDLAVEEGCVGETLGALLAKEQHALAKDLEVARVLARLERDEARHAELAWRFLAWALEHGEPDVWEAAEQAFARSAQAIAAMPVVDYGVDVELWHAHGRVTCQEARALSRRALSEVVGPCWQALRERVRADSPRLSPPTPENAFPVVL